METINAAELARNTNEILDRVANGEIIAIKRNHTLIAQIVPCEPRMTVVQALAGLRPMLAAGQGAAWLNQSKEEFEDTVRDSWADHDKPD